jgi:hypothetical protein
MSGVENPMGAANHPVRQVLTAFLKILNVALASRWHLLLKEVQNALAKATLG